VPATNPLDELIDAAGFKTKKAFAEAAGLADYEISRIGTKQRTPTSTQIRKIASALKKPQAEIARLLLPQGELEQEATASVIRERDQFLSELIAVREQLGEARSRVTNLGLDLSRLQAEKEKLADQLAQERVRAEGLERRQQDLRRQKTELEQVNRRLSGAVDEAQNKAMTIQTNAAAELSRVYRQFAELQNELGRERTAGLQKQILAGSFGAVVGAIVRGAASGSGKKNPT
jgi:chromosome segregation ATPase